MTINAYIFSWNMYGIEAIVPITQYEEYDHLKTIAKLKGEDIGDNPLKQILFGLKIRARYNTHRNYEIYAIECEPNITEESLWEMWDKNPQGMANLAREKGINLLDEKYQPVDTRKVLIS